MPRSADSDTARNILPEIIHFLFSLLQMHSLRSTIYLTPVLPFINVLKGKVSYEDTPGVLVSSTYVNCFCWYIYGDMIFSDQVKICNCIGSIISLCLIVIYLVYEIRKYTLDAILNALIIITGSYATYRGLTIVVDDDAVIGKICNVTSIIVFLNPMYLIYKVIREKNNYILIPIYTAWVSLFAYGLCPVRLFAFKEFPNIGI